MCLYPKGNEASSPTRCKVTRYNPHSSTAVKTGHIGLFKSSQYLHFVLCVHHVPCEPLPASAGALNSLTRGSAQSIKIADTLQASCYQRGTAEQTIKPTSGVSESTLVLTLILCRFWWIGKVFIFCMKIRKERKVDPCFSQITYHHNNNQRLGSIREKPRICR